MIRYLYMNAIEIVVTDGDMIGFTTDPSTFAEQRHHHFVLSLHVVHNIFLLLSQRRAIPLNPPFS